MSELWDRNNGMLQETNETTIDAKEVNEGYECGLGIERYNDLKVEDIIECFVEEEVERYRISNIHIRCTQNFRFGII